MLKYRLKYYNIRLEKDEFIYTYTIVFECCRDAATWLVKNGYSKSINAARVGLSSVLTGKRSHYRGFEISAEHID